jgi:N-acetylmuramoyl-L-alanine amidase
MAQTIWAEARGEPLAGQYAVAHVMRNRALHDTKSPATICTAPYQFSCWNADDPNLPHLHTLNIQDAAFCAALQISVEVLTGQHADPTHGARHYHTTTMTPRPRWARGHTPCYTVGHHVFYNDIT